MPTIALFLKNKKTYISVALLLATFAAQVSGHLEPTLAKMLYSLFGAGTVVGMRLAVKKVQDALSTLTDALPPAATTAAPAQI